MRMDKNANKIIEILEEKGFEARIAGGAVRDFLLGLTPKDIDIATTATPSQVIWAFSGLGYDVIETGLQHGTVTVMVDGIGYEVTTLRIDKKTDGRHAEVEFTDDWELDAARRDFTFNAMFMDKAGKVYDYFNGQEDLAKGIVRFVGSTEDRITEDFLRIMRWFRFYARFGMKGTNRYSVPSSVLSKIALLSGGLEKISGERIWSELKKILDTPDSFMSILAMTSNIAKPLRLPNNGNFHLRGADFDNGIHPLMKLIALYNFDASVITVMKERFKASYNEIEFVRAYFMLRDPRTTAYSLMKYAERRQENFDAILDIIRNDNSKRAAALKEFFSEHGWYAIPDWPFHAFQLIEEGYEPGQELGKELERRRKNWLDSRLEWDI